MLTSPEYFNSIYRTAIFSSGTTASAVLAGLAFAVLVDRVVRGKSVYRLLVIWPYAVAPVLAGVLWLFLFHPIYGAIALMLKQGFGVAWNPLLDGNDAMLLVIVAAAWKQVSYNFVFFLAALQAIPRSLIEAAAIDGAGPVRRFVSIVFPDLADHLLPAGHQRRLCLLRHVRHHPCADPGRARRGDRHPGVQGLCRRLPRARLGLSSAQSVILMILVIGLTAVQFRFLERRVKYAQ